MGISKTAAFPPFLILDKEGERQSVQGITRKTMPFLFFSFLFIQDDWRKGKKLRG
jgi:hypothetical protein